MTISEEMNFVNEILDLLNPVGGFIIFFGIGFLISACICRLLVLKMILENIENGVPVKLNTIAELIASVSKHGYKCEQIADNMISVYDPRNPKVGTIVYSFTMVDDEYGLMKCESSNIETPYSAYIASLPMMAVYNETVYFPETKTNLSGVDDEDFTKHVCKVAKNRPKHIAIAVIVFGIVFEIGYNLVAQSFENYYNQPAVKLQQGIEDTFGINLNGTSDYSFDADSDDATSKDDVKKMIGAPAKPLGDYSSDSFDVSDYTDDVELPETEDTPSDSVVSSSSSITSDTSSGTTTGKYIDMDDIFNCCILDSDGYFDPYGTADALTELLGINCTYSETSGNIVSDDGGVGLSADDTCIYMDFTNSYLYDYSVLGVRIGSTNFYDTETLFPSSVTSELNADNTNFVFNEDGTAYGLCRIYGTYDMKVVYFSDENETINEVSVIMQYK